MDQYWSWILSIIGLIGFYLAGRKVWWCWYVNIANQIIWLAYSIVTGQYGFLVATFGYSFVFIKNAIEWTKDHKDPFRNFDFNEYTHVVQPIPSEPSQNSFDVSVNEPFSYTFSLDLLEIYNEEDLRMHVESEKQNWLDSLPAAYRFWDVVIHEQDDFVRPNCKKITFEVRKPKFTDRRECGWMGCGNPKCEPYCKGVRSEEA